MARRKKKIEGVRIIDIGDRGHAIGKTPEGEVVILLDQPVPGDVVNMVATRKKKGLKHGFVTDYVTTSEHRVEPSCIHFGDCGGCKWQHFAYEQQALHKENTVKQVISRIAKDDLSKVEPVQKADRTYGYRNKLEYSFSTKRWLTQEEVDSGKTFDHRPGVGFHISGAFDKILHVDECLLQDSLSNTIRNRIHTLAQEKDWSYYHIRENKGLLRNLMIRNSRLGQWMVTVVFGERDQEKIDQIFDLLIPEFPQVNSWYAMVNTKMNSSYFDIDAVHISGEKHIEEILDDVRYKISPKSFFQTNPYQAEILYRQALLLAELRPTDIVYDLYTGTGSIALFLAKQCASVVGIEVVPEAIEDAWLNAEINQIKNAHFIVGDVKDVLTDHFQKEFGTPNVIVTDPPRAGMHEDVVKTILTLEADRVVYISCNPSTQARDILLLHEKYDLIKVVPVDMFPHTSHIESVALLTLRSEFK